MSAAALDLVRYGFTVFPLQPKSKEPPKGISWKALETRDEALVAQFPADCNIAVTMGRKQGILGLDCDCDRGATFDLLKSLPPTWVAKSGRGYHVYFRYPKHWPEIGKGTVLRGKSQDGKPVPCVELRANGHYFVAPGSIHPLTNTRYEWLKNDGTFDGLKCDFLAPGEIELADAPDFLLDTIAAKTGPKKSPGEKYGENQRHKMLTDTATAMRKAGHDEQAILSRLKERNEKDCSPPKENAEKELSGIARWAYATVDIDEKQLAERKRKEEIALLPSSERLVGIRALGHLDNDYFYLSESNQQVVKISDGAHGPQKLLNLMPYAFWKEGYGSDKKGINWTEASSHLMEACREHGAFNPRRVRGIGAWNESGNLLLHTGARLCVDGSSHTLFGFPSSHTYQLRPTISSPSESKASLSDCKLLLDACATPSWERPESAILLAGSLAILRMCGALPWRPHVWLTGSHGSGKTSIMNTLVKTMAGDWACHVQGVTTEAGIRQKLSADSLPVVFDEAESEDKRGAGRVKHVLELARQASSDSEARIVKGTADGKGMSFKINSCFFLASIQVNLTQQADQSRFTVLTLGKPKEINQWEFTRSLEIVSPAVADAIFSRMVSRYQVLLSNYRSLSAMIANKSNARHGQQYGMLLASYGCLISDLALDVVECAELIEKSGVCHVDGHESEMVSADTELINHIASSVVRTKLNELDGVRDYTIGQLIQMADTDQDAYLKHLQIYGISVGDGRVLIANSNPELAKLLANTRWSGSWWRTLRMADGSDKAFHRFLTTKSQRATSVPISEFLSDAPPDTPKGPF